MKTMDEIRIRIALLKPELNRRFKVNKIGIFGSYVRGEEREDSDVDILIELEEPIGLDLVELIFYLERELDMKVDLVTTKSLRPEFESQILNEVVYA